MFTSSRRTGGFTLVELMVIVAIIGLLSSVAMSSYQNYVDSTAAAAITTNYGEAIRATRNQLAAAESKRAAGLDAEATAPDNAPAWLPILNPSNRPAPGGDLAYEAGAGSGSTGAVGISVTGSISDGTLQVTISRPAYADLAPMSEVISQSS